MTSDKQIRANRRNALKSTGPKTPEGKAAVMLRVAAFAEAPRARREDTNQRYISRVEAGEWGATYTWRRS